jgi:cytoskeletal protein RodZ
VYLQAIEDGRFGDLPGPTYAAGFVRAYAEYLGLEIPEVMRRYREVTRGGATHAPLVAPSPMSEGRMPTGFILLMAAVLAGIAYGTWYYLTFNGRDAGDLVAQIPRKIADIVGMDRSSGETPTPSAAEAPPQSAVAPPAVAPPVVAPPVTPEPVTPAPVQSAAPPAEAPVRAAEPVDRDPAPMPRESAAEAPPAVEQPPPAAARAPESPPTPRPAEGERMSPAPGAVATVSLPAESEAGDSAIRPASMAEAAPSAGADAMTPAPVRAIEAAPAPAAEAAPAAPESQMAVSAGQGAPDQVASIPPAAPAAPAEEAPGRVVLRATAISWVELRDAGGKRIFSRLLKKGETYNVPAKTGITLATGNAGALDILVDGQTVSPIGPPGAVRRDVLLEPDALLGRGAAAR